MGAVLGERARERARARVSTRLLPRRCVLRGVWQVLFAKRCIAVKETAEMPNVLILPKTERETAAEVNCAHAPRTLPAVPRSTPLPLAV